MEVHIIIVPFSADEEVDKYKKQTVA